MSPAEVGGLLRAWSARERRADRRAGVIAMVLAEINRDADKRSQPFHPADFFPSLERERPEPPSGEELNGKIEAFFRAFGGVEDGA